MRNWLVLGIVIAAACGNDGNDGQSPEPELQDSLEGVRSGSRLKLRWMEVEGARNFHDVFDSALNASCNARLWDDGNTYCSPATVPLNVFKDASCTLPLARVFRQVPCAPPPAFVHQSIVAPACGVNSTSKIYKAAPVTVTEYYQLSDSGCSRSPFVDGSDFYEPTDEVASSDLVRMTRSEPEGTGRLRFVYNNGADGSRTFGQTVDTELDGSCLMIPSNNGQTEQCLVKFIEAYQYADATCSATPRAYAPSNCPVKPYVASGTTACPLDVKLYMRGDQTASSPLYQHDGVSCEQTEPYRDYTYYEVGAEVSMAALPRASTEGTQARILPVRNSDSEVSLHRPTFYDSQHRTDCEVTTLPDGSQRCLPTSYHSLSTASYFSDAACQTPLMLLSSYNEACTPAPVPGVAARKIAGTCPASYEVRAVGAVYRGPLYRNDGVDCVPHTSSEAHYLVGPPLPLTELASATLVTEP